MSIHTKVSTTVCFDLNLFSGFVFTLFFFQCCSWSFPPHFYPRICIGCLQKSGEVFRSNEILSSFIHLFSICLIDSNIYGLPSGLFSNLKELRSLELSQCASSFHSSFRFMWTVPQYFQPYGGWYFWTNAKTGKSGCSLSLSIIPFHSFPSWHV